MKKPLRTLAISSVSAVIFMSQAHATVTIDNPTRSGYPIHPAAGIFHCQDLGYSTGYPVETEFPSHDIFVWGYYNDFDPSTDDWELIYTGPSTLPPAKIKKLKCI